MAKIFFFILIITVFAGSNANRDVIRALDFLLRRCDQIEGFTSSLNSQIKTRRNHLSHRAEVSRRLSDKECRDRINEDHNRLTRLLNDWSNQASRFNSDVAQTKQYVQSIKNKGDNYMTQNKQELLETSRQKESELNEKLMSVKDLSIKFVPSASTGPSEFIFIQNCFKRY